MGNEYLLQKTKVEETEECNNLFPDVSASRVGIITNSGQELSELVHQNALTDEKIEQKFYSLTRDLLVPAQRKELLSLLWNLEQVGDVTNIMGLLKV